jgi:aerobic-type carbon monoxide dehydrogenase small subunit (CoxS/CutS family)
MERSRMNCIICTVYTEFPICPYCEGAITAMMSMYRIKHTKSKKTDEEIRQMIIHDLSKDQKHVKEAISNNEIIGGIVRKYIQ